MKYSKPEILVLGDAKLAIQGCTSKPNSGTDSSSCQSSATPAYDLDE